MAENTKIQWATHTFNPWRGCTKIAQGCANCYADAQSKRNPGTLGVWGPNGTRVVASEAMWREPVKWNEAAGLLPSHIVKPHSLPIEYMPVGRPRVFCASLADVFEGWPGRPAFTPEKVDGETIQPVAWYGPVKTHAGIVDQVCRAGQMLGIGIGSSFQVWSDRYRPATLDDVRARLFRLIDATPNLDWLLLTKRPENIPQMWPGVDADNGIGTTVSHRPNAWLGTSIACQEDADCNVPQLLKCRELCAKAFLSIEPLIGPVDLDACWPGGLPAPGRGPYVTGVDWVIVGGESGPNARPCDITWIRSIVRQCRDASVPVFVKQWGSNPNYTNHQGDSHSCGPIRDPKGGDMAEWPEDIRVREVPS